jgi:glycine/D-amino acid oxidase-like deaminating enzyme
MIFILCRSEFTGTVEGVQTSRNILYGRKAIIIASGAWTRSLLHSFLEPALTLDIPVKPRKVYLNLFGLIFDPKIFQPCTICHHMFT